MTIIISPAKKLTPTNNSLGVETTRSEFPDKLNELIDYAKSLSEKDLIEKMKISSFLAQLNFDRFQKFQYRPSSNASTQAIYTFKGENKVKVNMELLLTPPKPLLSILNVIYPCCLDHLKYTSHLRLYPELVALSHQRYLIQTPNFRNFPINDH